MKARQTKRLLSYLETGLACRENISVIAMVPGMMRAVQEYDSVLLDILESMYKHAEPIPFYGKDKREAKIKLVKHIDRLCSGGCAYAMEVNCHIILSRFEHSYSSIFRRWDSETVTICTWIYDGLKEHQEKLKEFGIRKKDIEELLILIEKFNKLIPKSGSARALRMVHTGNLQKRMNVAKRILDERMDKLLPFFEQFPEFTAAYEASRKQAKHEVTQAELEKKIKEFYLAPRVRKLRKKKDILKDDFVNINEFNMPAPQQSKQKANA
jgi:hypothetical protein